MARQESLTQFTGTIDNIIFYKSIDGYLARKKGGISAERIRTEPGFARTRENNAEFGRAVRASRLIRRAFAELLREVSDPRVTGRLNGAMMRVLQGDRLHGHGDRTVVDGNMAVLTDFNFNKNAKLRNTFHAPFDARMDDPSGDILIDVPAFIPKKVVSAPEGAMYFRFKAAAATLDFDKMEYTLAKTETENLPLTEELYAPIQLRITLPADSPGSVVAIFGIEFIQTVKSGGEHQMKTALGNAMAVVAAES